MDQIKIGKFISTCRKEQNITQATLAEKLGISDRAVSKWENGKSMPDSGLMLELCDILRINVNELLSGERLMSDSYSKKAEENLLAIKRENEEICKRMLLMENMFGIPGVFAAIIMLSVSYYVDMPKWIQIILIAISCIMILSFALLGVRIEQKAGYYECQHCSHRYVPTYLQTLMAAHTGTTRYMKCPKCQKKSWQKKVLSNEVEE